MDGDTMLGGLMMVHERQEDMICGPVMPQGGIQALEAMLFTLDYINDPRNGVLDRGMKVGARIFDDCDKETYGLEQAVDFIKGSISNIHDQEYKCSDGSSSKVKVIDGVVGAASSVTSIQVANLLCLFKIPQVSFFSTSPELSNKQRFEYFTRTIPSDQHQVDAMIEIVRMLNWTYISIIYEESSYGIKAYEQLQDKLGHYNICIAVKQKLTKDSGVGNDTTYDNIVMNLLTKSRARGVIVFASDQEVAQVMKAVIRKKETNTFSWIGSDGWSARALVFEGNEAVVEGTLSVQPQANAVRNFKEYFTNLTIETNTRNPWFYEYWEDHFKCKYINKPYTPYNRNYTRNCSGDHLSATDTPIEAQLQFVSDAVMAFAYAFKDYHTKYCNGTQFNSKPSSVGKCKIDGEKLLAILKNVSFTGLSGDQFQFDENGDGPARYRVIHFRRVTPTRYEWVEVGSYSGGKLKLDMDMVRFRPNERIPGSVCSEECERGMAKKEVEGESCCWHCLKCTDYQKEVEGESCCWHCLKCTDYQIVVDDRCDTCPQFQLPSADQTQCVHIPEASLDSAIILICTIYAWKTRKIPESFNESKYIGFTMYTTCVLWIAFLPIYYSTSNDNLMRTTTIAVTTNMSATVALVFLFLPKCHIILLHPERNQRVSSFGAPRLHSMKNQHHNTILAHAKVQRVDMSTQSDNTYYPTFEMQERLVAQPRGRDIADLATAATQTCFVCRSEDHNCPHSATQTCFVCRSEDHKCPHSHLLPAEGLTSSLRRRIRERTQVIEREELYDENSFMDNSDGSPIPYKLQEDESSPDNDRSIGYEDHCSRSLNGSSGSYTNTVVANTANLPSNNHCTTSGNLQGSVISNDTTGVIESCIATVNNNSFSSSAVNSNTGGQHISSNGPLQDVPDVML
ncbi:metabotropic glutamate receptor 3 [Hyalella azteca]|uniref:Metabotropic glutamate receptor 3 n=1 Tax=Hyalella azteca TaxID=294128 RepID=A0A8B7PG77_HYAAZ|nr:metabotropic glutamate receptor 3 [Hyalella azteca]